MSNQVRLLCIGVDGVAVIQATPIVVDVKVADGNTLAVKVRDKLLCSRCVADKAKTLCNGLHIVVGFAFVTSLLASALTNGHADYDSIRQQMPKARFVAAYEGTLLPTTKSGDENV